MVRVLQGVPDRRVLSDDFLMDSVFFVVNF
jgi:hypothetical protein